MGYQGERRFKIDLGVGYALQPCAIHTESGYNADCEACRRAPEREIKFPHLRGMWVEVLNPILLSYGRRKELYTPLVEPPPDATVEERRAYNLELQERRERIVAGLITAWNLTDVDADDPGKAEVLPLPKDDPDSLNRVPDILALVIAGINRNERNAENAVPLGTGISS